MSDEFRKLKEEAEQMSLEIELAKKDLAEKEGKLESLLLQMKALSYEGDSESNNKPKRKR